MDIQRQIKHRTNFVIHCPCVHQFNEIMSSTKYIIYEMFIYNSACPRLTGSSGISLKMAVKPKYVAL